MCNSTNRKSKSISESIATQNASVINHAVDPGGRGQRGRPQTPSPPLHSHLAFFPLAIFTHGTYMLEFFHENPGSAPGNPCIDQWLKTSPISQ